MHPSTDVPIVEWKKDKMKVIWHQAVSEKPQRDSLTCELHQGKKSPVVLFVVINGCFVVAATKDVVADIADESACASGHAEDCSTRRRVSE